MITLDDRPRMRRLIGSTLCRLGFHEWLWTLDWKGCGRCGISGGPARAESKVGHGIRCRVSCHGSKWRCHSAGCGAAGHVSGGMAYESNAPTLGVAVDELPGHHAWAENEKCLFDTLSAKEGERR